MYKQKSEALAIKKEENQQKRLLVVQALNSVYITSPPDRSVQCLLESPADLLQQAYDLEIFTQLYAHKVLFYTAIKNSGGCPTTESRAEQAIIQDMLSQIQGTRVQT